MGKRWGSIKLANYADPDKTAPHEFEEQSDAFSNCLMSICEHINNENILMHGQRHSSLYLL